MDNCRVGLPTNGLKLKAKSTNLFPITFRAKAQCQLNNENYNNFAFFGCETLVSQKEIAKLLNIEISSI